MVNACRARDRTQTWRNGYQVSSSIFKLHCIARRSVVQPYCQRAKTTLLRCSAGGTPAISVEEEIWNSRETPPHPSPPEHFSPTELLGGECTIQQLAEQIHTLKGLVQAQQDILYSQKAKIDQLTETLQEECLRATQAAGPGLLPGTPQLPLLSPFEAENLAFGDRRLMGMYDARFHSTLT